MADFPLDKNDIRDFLSLVDAIYDVSVVQTVRRAKTNPAVWVDADGVSAGTVRILRRIAGTLDLVGERPQETDPE